MHIKTTVHFHRNFYTLHAGCIFIIKDIRNSFSLCNMCISNSYHFYYKHVFHQLPKKHYFWLHFHEQILFQFVVEQILHIHLLHLVRHKSIQNWPRNRVSKIFINTKIFTSASYIVNFF